MWNHAPLFPFFLLSSFSFSPRPPLFFGLALYPTTLKMKGERERRNPARWSHRWFRMNLSERHPCPSSLWFLVRDLVGLGSLSCGGNRKTLEAGYFHGRDGHNIGAAEISCGSRPPPISTTTIIESGVYRRKSSILSIIPPLHLSYFDRLNRFWIFYRFIAITIAPDFASIVNEN